MGALISILVQIYKLLFPGNVQITPTPTQSAIAESSPSPPSSLSIPQAERSISSVVAQTTDFQDGEMKECELGEGKVLVIRDGDKFYATGTKCTHYSASLKTGAYHNGRIRCPWHGACFNVKTGDIEDFPGLDNIPTFNVDIEGKNIHVRGVPELIKKSAVTHPMVKRNKDDERVFVIVGGGAAGATAAETLRGNGYTGRIVVISREKVLPYDRPKLSKAMSIAVDKIYLRSQEFYDNHEIEFILGTTVTELDSETKVITLSNGKTIKYDSALLAPGADPQRLPFIPGYDASNVHVLRTYEEAAAINEAAKGKSVVIVGSSFIGMETASCIAKSAKSVIVIGMEKVPFERVLGFEIGNIMQQFHENNGIKFIMEAICQEFKTVDGKVNSILLKNGKEINDVEVVIIGAGVIPCTSFIKPSAKLVIEKDRSVLVNEYLFTGADGLYAAGDIARYPFHMTPGQTVRVEHWGTAQVQGQVAAKNMLKGDQPTHKVSHIPFFWTVQYGKSLRYCGHALSYEDVIIDDGGEKIDLKNPKFVAYYIYKGYVLACCSLNRDPAAARVSELLNSGIIITAEEIKESIKSEKSADDLIIRKLREPTK